MSQTDFIELLKAQNMYKQALELMTWDRHTSIPSKALNGRLEVIGYFSEKLHRLQTSSEMNYFIEMFADQNDAIILQKAAKECKKTYDRKQKIPVDDYKNYVMLCSESEAVWQEARKTSDFSLLKPYLQKIVAYNQQFAEQWGYNNHIYDALLEEHEPGITVKQLDEIFPDLRRSLTALLERIQESKTVVRSDVLKKHFPLKQQEELSLQLLQRIGYDLEAGRMDTSAHPYTFGINSNDVRISTHYNEDDFRQAVFSAMHEGGHGLYEQNFADNIHETVLAEASSMGMHEAQALFWESFISRNKIFWEANHHLLRQYAPESISQLTLNEFYRSMHEVSPGLIRLDADEVTYPIHIMIRYELEKDLLSGDLAVDDLPGVWNEKMAAYLGVKPKNDAEGVLQDIHWSSGDFGYFPSYALGYMYAAQLYKSIDRDIDITAALRNNRLGSIKDWLIKNVYQYGKMKTPLEIISGISGEGLEPEPFVSYLTKKYSDIYDL